MDLLRKKDKKKQTHTTNTSSSGGDLNSKQEDASSKTKVKIRKVKDIYSLPVEKLVTLTTIDLSNLSLASLPPTLAACTALTDLNLSNNYFTQIPQEVFIYSFTYLLIVICLD